jgi:hypothetical protein
MENSSFLFLFWLEAEVSVEILMVLVGDSSRYLASKDQSTIPEFMTKNK